VERRGTRIVTLLSTKCKQRWHRNALIWQRFPTSRFGSNENIFPVCQSFETFTWLTVSSRNQWNIKAQILKMCSTSAKGGEKGDPNRNPWLAKMISPSRVLILFVFYIRHISSSRVLIFWLCSMFITSVLHGFWFSVCVLCSSHKENQNPWSTDGIDTKHKQRIRTFEWLMW
jgi:hypothetical protein